MVTLVGIAACFAPTWSPHPARATEPTTSSTSADTPGLRVTLSLII